LTTPFNVGAPQTGVGVGVTTNDTVIDGVGVIVGVTVILGVGVGVGVANPDIGRLM